MRIRTLALASAALIATALLAGCTPNQTMPDTMPGMDHGSSSSPSSTSAQFNAADEMFATMMIPHHQQAIEMADMILGKDDIDPQVVTLAEQIKAAQGPEIETMKGWLEEWGAPYDESAVDGMSGMDHGDGMMSDEDMTALESATGTEATRLFLDGMIMHHQGAITMAQSQLDNGQNEDALELAQQVIDGQSAEITTMQAILATL
ncbi:DUF305 domain-containing protein [Microbacterium sp. NPDC078814]|uniref:DUF305 domain-containing protein n=1 Tax=Microbacterium sp. NPDC078814 TaxID=3154767 RepID=UPI003450878F